MTWFFYLNRLSSISSDRHRRSKTQLKKSERQPLPRNQVFSDGIADSFFVSSSISISRQGTYTTKWNTNKLIRFLIKCRLFIHSDVPKIFAPSSKRYVSSFKTLVNSSNSKQTQRLNYINDSVMIFKLSKKRKKEKQIFSFLLFSIIIK